MNLFKEILHYISIYVRHGKGRLLVLFVIILTSGFVEMLGITMMIPILNLSFDTAGDNAISLIFKQIFDIIGVSLTLNNILIMLLIIFAIKGIITFLQKYYTAIIALSLRKVMQISVVEAVNFVNYSEFSKINSGHITNIITKETAGFASSFSEFARMGSAIVYIIFYMIAFAALSPEIALVLLIITGFIYFAFKGLSKKTKNISIETTKEYGDISNKSIEVLQNYVYLKATNKLYSYTSYVIDYIKSIQNKERKLMFYASLVGAIKEPIAVAALVGLIFYQVSLMGQPLTEVIVIGLLLYRMLNQVLLLQGQWQRFNSCLGSLEVIENTLSSFKENSELSNGKPIDKIPMPISLKNITFSHGKTPILHNISMEIKDKQTVGIVGPSGAGKTTLFYLITGLVTPDSGKITLGGIDYNDIDKEVIRSKIGYVSQDAAIFTGTIKDNLILDRNDISLDDIKSALSEASCAELIESLDKEVGDQGKNLSGGQKQRISIARELLKKPEMLIFDEATSALDPLSDSAVRQTIANMNGSRTMILITHRLSSVRFCDIIYVVNNGKIVEQGSFEDLANDKTSFFYKLIQK